MSILWKRITQRLGADMNYYELAETLHTQLKIISGTLEDQNKSLSAINDTMQAFGKWINVVTDKIVSLEHTVKELEKKK